MSETTAATGKVAPLTPDLCVIGGGPAGLAIASAAAAFGVAVVLVERGAMGGSSFDAGSAPLLALAAAGARAQAVRDAGDFGILAGEAAVKAPQLHDHVQRTLTALAGNDSAERLTALGARVLRAEARFVSRSTVMAGEQPIKARRFVIATGSRPALPSLPGLDGVSHLTCDSVPALTRLPDRPIVLGGGATGVELAQAMARLGSQVTLVSSGQLLADEDPEAAAILRRALLRDGVVLHEDTQALRAEPIRGGLRLTIGAVDGGSEKTLEGTHLLIATGRIPNVDTLDLDMAGIASDATGVIVGKALRTANRRVHAIGGCAGGVAAGQRSTQAALHQASLVLRNVLFRQTVRFDPALVPHMVCGRPEIASVGISEAQARARGGALQILRWPHTENQRAQAERETEGFVKIIADGKGRLLGAVIVGSGAGETIAPWCLALSRQMTLRDMAGQIFPQASLADSAIRVAASSYAPLASKPGIRRLIGFLRRFG